MKTLAPSHLFLLLFTVIYGLQSQAQYITIEGKQFYDSNHNEFYPLLINYNLELAFDASSPSTYYPAPHPQYGANINAFDCISSPTCLLAIQQDFERIKNMGFNSIRLVGLTPRYKSGAGYDRFYVHGWTNNNPINGGLPSGTPIPTPPTTIYNDEHFLWFDDMPFVTPGTFPLPTSCPEINNFFNTIKDVLAIAALPTIDLKIIIDASPSGISTSPKAISDYNLYLGFLGTFINSLPAASKANFMGYVMVEEPLFTDHAIGYKKQEICEMTNTWYTTLKTADPYHLITVGLWDVKEVDEWDMANIKCDFLQPHIYPMEMQYESYDYTNALNRVLASIYWFGKKCPMPWMIGETGFSCKTGFTNPIVDGTESQQASFAQTTLNAVRDAGGSGYSFWFFQETNWDHYQDGFGLLRSSHSSTETPSSLCEKDLAVNVFRNYLYTQTGFINKQPPPISAIPFTVPSSILNDPFNHSAFSPNLNIVSGNVDDQYSAHIENAFVDAWTLLKPASTPPITTYDIFDEHYVYTSAPAGHFNIIPYDFSTDGIIENGTIEALKISAPGADRFFYNWGYSSYTSGSPNIIINTSPLPTVYPLNSAAFEYDGNVDNVTVNLTQIRNFKSWNSLNVTNTTILGVGTSGGSSEFKARNYVKINPEFHAQSGSEVHIFTQKPLFWDCLDLDFSNYNKNQNTSIPHNVEYNENKIVEVSFKKPFTNMILNIIPNPSKGNFNVEILKAGQEFIQFELTSIIGKSILKSFSTTSNFFLDISYLTPGVYFLKAISQNQQQVKKIIIN